mmetsp:Transcript_6666/g.14570  ORF Transcript_6666/g.14570 Transcript_6666/m.14570 type:complete len:371 (+) Transcript_6666:36-1148(+)
MTVPETASAGDDIALAKWRVEKLIKSRVKSIKARGGTAEEQFAALADRVKDEVFDIEYELQALLKKGQYKKEPSDIDAFEQQANAEAELQKGKRGPRGEYRKCQCGCGKLLFNCDESPEQPWEPQSRKLLEELDRKAKEEGTKVDAAAQKAHCEKMFRSREAKQHTKSSPERASSKATSEAEETVTSPPAQEKPKPPARPPDYVRLTRLAKPREAPEVPEDMQHPFQPQLMPRKVRPRRDRSEPILSPTNHGEEEHPESPTRYTSLPPVPFGPDVMKMMQSPLAMLGYHAKKSKNGSAAGPRMHRSSSVDSLPRLNCRSVASQRQYTEARLYTKPKHAPGSNAELLARLHSLREHNQARQLERQQRAVVA